MPSPFLYRWMLLMLVFLVPIFSVRRLRLLFPIVFNLVIAERSVEIVVVHALLFSADLLGVEGVTQVRLLDRTVPEDRKDVDKPSQQIR